MFHFAVVNLMLVLFSSILGSVTVQSLHISLVKPTYNKMDIRGAVDAAVPTNIIAAKAAEVRANQVNWQSYLQ